MTTIEQSFAVTFNYPVVFTRDAFSPDNEAIPEILSRSGRTLNRVLAVVEAELIAKDPDLLDKMAAFAARHEESMVFVAPPVIVRGGEYCKNDPLIIHSIQAMVERYGICRHSFVLAIGGGALLDAAGFAAATAHRGIRLIRMPTTVLGQNDAGIGVKNGVNAFGRKNFLGAFAPPFAVVNDFDFLRHLPERDLRSGISEAVKVALIKDRKFFSWLYDNRPQLRSFQPKSMEKMIIRCAELHMQHIGSAGDPFESGSSRPLDFGHWAAHKLEDMTNGEIRHGEAVAIGIALDSLYSRRLGLIADLDLYKIMAVLEDVGFELYHPALKWLDVKKAVEEFREHLGGIISIPLLSGIGNKIEAHEINLELYRQAIAALGERHPLRNKTSFPVAGGTRARL